MSIPVAPKNRPSGLRRRAHAPALLRASLARSCAAALADAEASQLPICTVRTAADMPPQGFQDVAAQSPVASTTLIRSVCYSFLGTPAKKEVPRERG